MNWVGPAVAVIGIIFAAGKYIAWQREKISHLQAGLAAVATKNNRAQLIMVALEPEPERRMWMVGIFRE